MAKVTSLKYGHFIVLSGMEKGKIRIHDPNNVANSESLWDYDTFKAEIKNAWAYGDATSEKMIIVTEHASDTMLP